MVVMSIDAYSKLTKNVEQALSEADEYAAVNPERLTHDEVFGRLRRQING
jgi:hypothetical protein